MVGKEDNYKYLVELYTHVFFFQVCFGQFTTGSSSFHSYSATSCVYDNVEVKEKSVTCHASEIIAGKDVGVFIFFFFAFKSFSGSIFNMYLACFIWKLENPVILPN